MRRFCPVLFPATAFLFSILVSCGVKSPPLWHVNDFPVRVSNLNSEWQGEDLYLTGNISGLDRPEEALDLIKGCRLYHALYKADVVPCEGCPIDYSGFHMYGGDVLSSNNFSIKIPKSLQGEISYYRVNLIGPGGSIGPSSDTIKVKIQKY